MGTVPVLDWLWLVVPLCTAKLFLRVSVFFVVLQHHVKEFFNIQYLTVWIYIYFSNF